MNEILKEISRREELQGKDVESQYIEEEFVEIKESERIKLDLQYKKLNFDNAIDKAYVRKTVYDMLLKALEFLPEEYNIKIFDAWRPFALQRELFEKYTDDIIREFNLKDLPKNEQDVFISKFVAMPVEGENAPAHTTGGAIDLVLTRSDGTDLEMGVGFDEFSDYTYSDSYEKIKEEGMTSKDREIQKNRRILYNCMVNAGFTNIPSEIWHYDFGNRNWAFYSGKKCIYRGYNSIEDLHIIKG